MPGLQLMDPKLLDSEIRKVLDELASLVTDEDTDHYPCRDSLECGPVCTAECYRVLPHHD